MWLYDRRVQWDTGVGQF